MGEKEGREASHWENIFSFEANWVTITGDHSVDTSFVKNQNRQADKEEKILYILGTVQKITMKEKTFHLGHKLII